MIREHPETRIVQHELPRVILVETSPQVVVKLGERLQDWVISPEVEVPRPRPVRPVPRDGATKPEGNRSR